MRIVQLNELQAITLDGSGNGQAQLGPTAAGEVWPAGYVVGVHCATNVAEAIARGWAGGGPPAGFLGATTWGSTGDTNADTPELKAGQSVTVQWAGGDPGTVAYLTVTGSRQVP